MMLTQLKAVVIALAVLAGVSGCGGGEQPQAGPTPAPVSARPVRSFELYLLASAANNPLFADVYGLALDPFGVHRLTSGKRISALDASPERVAVAAADGDVDRLGYVVDGGEIGEIGGLGRPNAYRPAYDGDGNLLFSDYTVSGPDTAIEFYRFFSYDPRSERKQLLFQTKTDLAGPIANQESSLAFVPSDDGTHKPSRLLLKTRSGRAIDSFPLPAMTGYIMRGRADVAIALQAADSQFGDKPTDLLLLDPKTGIQRRVEGWQPITWTPDGEKLLVRRTGSTTDSELALLDPDRPTATPEPLGTIPNLVVYSGAWVDRG